MPTLLHVDASFRTEGSTSRAIADSAASAWLAENPSGTLTRRDLSAAPIPADAWALSIGTAYAPQENWSPEQRAAKDLATTLADEVVNADVLLVASPLFNFGISQYTKVWIDMLITDPRLGPGSTALEGKPALLVIAQGGGYRAGAPRHGWDHATAYLERIFRDNFGMTVNTVIADLTLAATTPAMAHLVEAAEQALSDAHDNAARHVTRVSTAGQGLAA